ncbi:TMEM165/GDT1 family protein [Euzebya rosea]|uniref:TMEM165/GDT1 family protein n=1 Tax=Euzebya rosea TaxID=2052804 RepID=UPI000D3E2E2A|nr:TMEM165/GDT1 family protein [Euzebya rosea]
MLDAIGVAFATVFLAELGDKSQLLALSLSARYRRSVLLLAVLTASAVTMAVSVTVGNLVGQLLPTRAITAAAAILFVAFGVLTLRGGEEEGAEGEEEAGDASSSGFVGIVAALSLAEFGDKTMVATFALAAASSAVGTWIGATAGMALAGAIGVVIGGALWTRLSPRTVRLVSGGLFLVVGVVLLVDALTG